MATYFKSKAERENNFTAIPGGKYLSKTSGLTPESKTGTVTKHEPVAGDRPRGDGPEAGWMNLQDYLGLNKQQGENMAKEVGGKVQQKAQTAKQASDQAWNDFNKGASSVNGPLNAAAMTGDGNVWTSEQASQLAQQKYDGPMSLNDMNGKLGGQINEAQADVNKLKTADGQAGLFTENYSKGGSYNAMQSGMDAWLAGTQGGDEWDQLVGQFGDLQSDYRQRAADAQAIGAMKKQQYDNAAKSWGDMIPGMQASEEAERERQKIIAAQDQRSADAKLEQESNARTSARHEKDELSNQSTENFYYANVGTNSQWKTYEDWVAAGMPGW